MNFKKRVEKLEAAARVKEGVRIMAVIVPARDGKPYGTEKGIQRIKCGARTWLRIDGETEEEFKARVDAETPEPTEYPTGMAAVYARMFTAYYGDDDA